MAGSDPSFPGTYGPSDEKRRKAMTQGPPTPATRAAIQAGRAGHSPIDTEETETEGPGGMHERMESAEDEAIEKRMSQLDAGRAKALGPDLDKVADGPQEADPSVMAKQVLQHFARDGKIGGVTGYTFVDTEGAGYEFQPQQDGSIKVVGGPKAVGKIIAPDNPGYPKVLARLQELAAAGAPQIGE